MAPISARMALQSLECLADIIAVELLLGAQALDLRFRVDGYSAPESLRGNYMVKSCKHVAFWEDDEVLHPAILCIVSFGSGWREIGTSVLWKNYMKRKISNEEYPKDNTRKMLMSVL